MGKIGVVFHSGHGHTARQAEAVCEGVCQGCAVPLLLRVDEARDHWDELAAADAVVFGAPTYMGSASAAFQAFMEATSTPLLMRGAWNGKLAAGFTNSGARAGDKLATLIQLALFAAQHGMLWVSLGLPPGNNSSQGSESDLNRLGFWLGAGAQSNVDEGPELAPPRSDLLTALHLGRRVAETAAVLARGRTL